MRYFEEDRECLSDQWAVDFDGSIVETEPCAYNGKMTIATFSDGFECWECPKCGNEFEAPGTS